MLYTSGGGSLFNTFFLIVTQMAFSFVMMQIIPSMSTGYDTPTTPVEHLSNILFGHTRSEANI